MRSNLFVCLARIHISDQINPQPSTQDPKAAAAAAKGGKAPPPPKTPPSKAGAKKGADVGSALPASQTVTKNVWTLDPAPPNIARTLLVAAAALLHLVKDVKNGVAFFTGAVPREPVPVLDSPAAMCTGADGAGTCITVA